MATWATWAFTGKFRKCRGFEGHPCKVRFPLRERDPDQILCVRCRDIIQNNRTVENQMKRNPKRKKT